MKKITSIALVLAMLFSAMLGIVSYAGEDTAPQLEIAYANVELGNAVYLYIAVDYTAFDSADGITLKITNTVSGKTSELTPDKRIYAPSGCVAFRHANMGNTNMGDEFKLQAYKDGVASGEEKTYSVLEYALKSYSLGDAQFIKLVDAMIDYGASQQKLVDRYGTYNLGKKWSLVVAQGATIRKAIVERGSELSLAPAVAGKSALYTSAFDRIEGTKITASEAYNSYIFLDESARTDLYFNFGGYSGDSETVNASFSEAGASLVKSYYANASGVYTDASALTSPVALTVKSGTLTEEAPDGGYLTLEKGSLKIAAGKNSGFDATVSELPSGMLSESCVTVTFSVRVIDGLDMAGGPKFKASTEEGGEIALYNATDKYIYLGSEKNVLIGNYYAGSYITFHVVLDTAAGRITAYNESGKCLGSMSASLADGAEISSLSWAVGADCGVEIAKCLVTKGNIFN